MAFPSGQSRPIHNVEWSLTYVWSVDLLTWVPMTQPGGSGPGGTVDQGAAGADPWLMELDGALPAGDNNIGNVDVASLPAGPSSATLANVTGDGTSKELAASNASRRVLTIFNDSGVVCYVKLGIGASSTSFTVKMVDQSYYEMPQPCYTGAVEALWASGVVRVTEL